MTAVTSAIATVPAADLDAEQCVPGSTVSADWPLAAKIDYYKRGYTLTAADRRLVEQSLAAVTSAPNTSVVVVNECDLMV